MDKRYRGAVQVIIPVQVSMPKENTFLQIFHGKEQPAQLPQKA